MSRLPPDFLPPYPSNQSGQQAPVTRLRLGVPKGVVLTAADRQHVEDEIFKRYRNQSRQQLETFRQMRNASTIELAAQRRKIDEFVSAKYYSHQGLERFTLTVSEELVEEILEEKLNPLCLLIEHTGGIKAVRMSNVYSHNFAIEFESTNGSSSGKTGHTQQQMSNKWSYSTRYGVLTDTEVGRGSSGGGAELLNGSASGAGITLYTDESDIFIDVANKTSQVTGTHDPTNVWAVTSDGERKERTEEDNTSGPYGYGTKKTTYWFEQSETGSGRRRSAQAPTVIKKTKDYKKAKDKTWSQTSLAGFTYGDYVSCVGNGFAKPNFTSTEQHTDDEKEWFDGELIWHVYSVDNGTSPVQKYWVKKRVETHGPVSLDIVVFFTDPLEVLWGWAVSSGGVGTHYSVVASDTKPSGSLTSYVVGFNNGILSAQPNASNVVTSTFDGVYLYGGRDWWIQTYNEAFCGAHHISTEITYDGPFSGNDVRLMRPVTDPNKRVTPHKFPYAVGNKIYKTVKTYSEDGSSSTESVYTPYDTLVDSAEWTTFTGWMNLSDGGVLIQGCYVNTPSGYVYGLYIDGEKYNEVAGVSVENISTMTLNVPLDWIKQQF